MWDPVILLWMLMDWVVGFWNVAAFWFPEKVCQQPLPFGNSAGNMGYEWVDSRGWPRFLGAEKPEIL